MLKPLRRSRNWHSFSMLARMLARRSGRKKKTASLIWAKREEKPEKPKQLGGFALMQIIGNPSDTMGFSRWSAMLRADAKRDAKRSGKKRRVKGQMGQAKTGNRQEKTGRFSIPLQHRRGFANNARIAATNRKPRIHENDWQIGRQSECKTARKNDEKAGAATDYESHRGPQRNHRRGSRLPGRVVGPRIHKFAAFIE